MDTVKKTHSLLITDEKFEISGITNVEGSDEKNITVNLFDRKLMFIGEELNILKLDLEEGRLSANGKISMVRYCHSHEKLPFFKRIFK